MPKIEISVIHIKEVEALLNLLAKYKDELPQALVDQLLLLDKMKEGV